MVLAHCRMRRLPVTTGCSFVEPGSEKAIKVHQGPHVHTVTGAEGAVRGAGIPVGAEQLGGVMPADAAPPWFGRGRDLVTGGAVEDRAVGFDEEQGVAAEATGDELQFGSGDGADELTRIGAIGQAERQVRLVEALQRRGQAGYVLVA